MNWIGYKAPPMVDMYFTYLVYKRLLRDHNLRTHAKLTEDRAKIIYDVIDRSSGFYHCPVLPEHRSNVSPCFHINGNDVEMTD